MSPLATYSREDERAVLNCEVFEDIFKDRVVYASPIISKGILGHLEFEKVYAWSEKPYHYLLRERTRK